MMNAREGARECYASAAPCGCLPDCLIAAVAEIAVARGRSFDEQLVGFIYRGMCEEAADTRMNGVKDVMLEGVNLLNLSQAMETAG